MGLPVDKTKSSGRLANVLMGAQIWAANPGHFSLIPTAVQGTEQTCTGAYQHGMAAFSDDFHRLDQSQRP